MALVPPAAAELAITPTDPPAVSTLRHSSSSPRDRYDAAAIDEKSDSDLEDRVDGAAGPGDGPGSSNSDAEGQYARRRPNDDGIYYPEGGFKAWMVVVGSCFGTAVTLGMMNTVGTIQAYVREHQLKEYDEGTTGWIFSTFIFLGFFGGVQVGPVFDAHGPRMLILAGSVCLGASMMLLGLCTQYWHFMLCFGILGGIGASLIFTPALSAISHWFNEKRATATGIAAAGGSVGGIVFPLALQKLYTVVSFAWATRIVGFLVIFCCAVTFILVRSRLPPKPGQSVIPSLRILRDPAYLFVTLGTYFMEWALFVPIAYITAFALSTGAMSTAFSYQLIAIMNAGSSIGRAHDYHPMAPCLAADHHAFIGTNHQSTVDCVCIDIRLCFWVQCLPGASCFIWSRACCVGWKLGVKF
ncbi:riboflavin transporter MCH5 [Nannizzia gypsea CBS 118893]|uniref:Riboflavin transporter MCH5 n=1 Tax=Arthroderma gypseum (strain ATCC MYA-4604 / CBS 118893) TaxID=535722 RepID=E4UWK1_ARTGP|nr:riboflavin transporter MCH5 [Nannizzia gypsea CBS 118893]EFR01757.1 riboflavin transporter MCH5 [Nannizzia gypsea CBS 118893]